MSLRASSVVNLSKKQRTNRFRLTPPFLSYLPGKTYRDPTMYMMKQILAAVLLIGSQIYVAPGLFSLTGQATDGQEWIDALIEYYTKLMRGQEQHGAKDRRTASKLYFTLQNIRQGKYHHAKAVYRRALDEIERLNEDSQCENAKLTSTIHDAAACPGTPAYGGS
eukprot:scaffold65193_cov41-Attheya_sp.AAC.2